MTWLREAVRAIDWPVALQRVGSTMRALRGDATVAHDAAADAARVERLKGSMRELARHVAGCSRAVDCSCVVCKERGPNG